MVTITSSLPPLHTPNAPQPKFHPRVTATYTPIPTVRSRMAGAWKKVKDEVHHYYLGTKLLIADVRIAARLVRAVMNGHELTRRERRQLIRTSTDLVRMVPFAVIVLIPFAELALPVILKVFPNMLPSTYLDSVGRDAKLKKQLLLKMEMAKFLQETTHRLATQMASKSALKGDDHLRADRFRSFMAQVRSGAKVRNSDLLAFAPLFDAELTLENLNRDQLAAMCRLLDIKVFGGDWVLRFKIEERMKQLHKDDELISSEGIEALDETELKEACRARGIYTGSDKDTAYMKRKLKDWLELSLDRRVPVTLLLLSRAFSRPMTGVESIDLDLSSDLASTLAHVPDVAVEEAEKELVDRSDDKAAKLRSMEEEAVVEAFEQIRARKESGSDDGVDPNEKRKLKLQQTKPAIGVTKERLARMEEWNEDVEELVDETLAQKEKEKEKQKQKEKEKEKKSKEVEEKTMAAAEPVIAPAEPAAAATTVDVTPTITAEAPPAQPTTATTTPPATGARLPPPLVGQASTASKIPAPDAATTGVDAAELDLTPTTETTEIEVEAAVKPAAGTEQAETEAAEKENEKEKEKAPVEEEEVDHEKDVVKEEVDEKAARKQEKKAKRTIQVVDRLNERVGALLDEIKKEAEEMEKNEGNSHEHAHTESTKESAAKKEKESSTSENATSEKQTSESRSKEEKVDNKQ